MDKNCKDCIESKVPKNLQEILKDEKKREKLIIFINPPYAEAASKTTISHGTNKNKTNVSNETLISKTYMSKYKNSIRELYMQFFIRIIEEIPHCTLASFSKLKYINSSNFVQFRETFRAQFLGGFLCPAFTFDNVKGQFPIGFLVWNLSQKVKFRKINLEVFDSNGEFLEKKRFSNNDKKEARSINQWLKNYVDTNSNELCAICCKGTDFQNNNFCNINFWDSIKGVGNAKGITKFKITQNNLISTAIYFAVRHAIPATWLNDRDQFLYPNDLWQQDSIFQNDCLTFMLFYGQNRITSKEGINHFIPFSEREVGAKEAFASNFMVQFINGKIKSDSICHSKIPPCHSEALAEESQKAKSPRDISACLNYDKKPKQEGFEQKDFYAEQTSFIPTQPLSFSDEAQAVFAAGLELWKYYHSQNFSDSRNPYNANASLYDIKAYFQGFNDKGKMNLPQKAQDSHYRDLIGNLNYELKILAKKIEPKIYEYGFLLE